jgi:hypothetical protein
MPTLSLVPPIKPWYMEVGLEVVNHLLNSLMIEVVRVTKIARTVGEAGNMYTHPFTVIKSSMRHHLSLWSADPTSLLSVLSAASVARS